MTDSFSQESSCTKWAAFRKTLWAHRRKMPKASEHFYQIKSCGINKLGFGGCLNKLALLSKLLLNRLHYPPGLGLTPPAGSNQLSAGNSILKRHSNGGTSSRQNTTPPNREYAHSAGTKESVTIRALASIHSSIVTDRPCEQQIPASTMQILGVETSTVCRHYFQGLSYFY